MSKRRRLSPQEVRESPDLGVLYRLNYDCYFDRTYGRQERVPKLNFYYEEFRIIKETDKSWTIIVGNYLRCVHKNTSKKFAHYTRKEAQKDFHYRAVKRKGHLTKQTIVADLALEQIRRDLYWKETF